MRLPSLILFIFSLLSILSFGHALNTNRCEVFANKTMSQFQRLAPHLEHYIANQDEISVEPSIGSEIAAEKKQTFVQKITRLDSLLRKIIDRPEKDQHMVLVQFCSEHSQGVLRRYSGILNSELISALGDILEALLGPLGTLLTLLVETVLLLVENLVDQLTYLLGE
ncbi:hypothetical protein N7504_008542 [Penicillium tannophilum]|nr:hypothetical protein N7504_008542 [Penicillium tannophilum]